MQAPEDLAPALTTKMDHSRRTWSLTTLASVCHEQAETSPGDFPIVLARGFLPRDSVATTKTFACVDMVVPVHRRQCTMW